MCWKSKLSWCSYPNIMLILSTEKIHSEWLDYVYHSHWFVIINICPLICRTRSPPLWYTVLQQISSQSFNIIEVLQTKMCVHVFLSCKLNYMTGLCWNTLMLVLIMAKWPFFKIKNQHCVGWKCLKTLSSGSVVRCWPRVDHLVLFYIMRVLFK